MTTTTRKPTTTRQAMSACRKAGVQVDAVEQTHRTFTVSSRRVAEQVAKVTGWTWFTTQWGGYVMQAQPAEVGHVNAR